MNTIAKNKVFLTGVTGFIGKVVLEELLRRREELGLEKVYVLIRPGRRGEDPKDRFHQEVESSPCFSKLPAGWTQVVDVIPGELTQEACGLSDADRALLTTEIDQIINCAASVEFDLPVKEAAKANIVSSLNVLSLARQCKRLSSMVTVSTAYVTPYKLSEGKNIGEYLVPLPRPAREIYRDIQENRKPTHKILAETGHPNTYTLTKCLAEHLLEADKGNVPLKFIRPSIVSASWRYPFTGWIDSKAAFAGFVALIGAGYLRAVVAKYDTLLDVVPCDEVAARIIDTAFESTQLRPAEAHIRHAVCGVRHSCNIQACISTIEDYFRRHPLARYPDLNYVGGKTFKFHFKATKFHHVPGKLLQTWHGLRGQNKRQSQVKKLMSQLNYLNSGFNYFTNCTFDFRSSMPLEHSEFWKEKYIEAVCMGVYHHLMNKDATEVSFAGKKHQGFKKDYKWARTQPKGNWAIRTSAYFVRKGLRKCTESITYDRTAFEAAAEQIPGDCLTVIVPTHRSYMDFILCSYLFFDQPDLRIAIPHIAAAQEFSKIPILGWLFKQMQAFYIKRGLGKENPTLTRQLHDLVQRRQTLEFFIEGTRSRSRKFLAPKRGILRCLQGTGQKCRILPVSITYDRVPEEGAFLQELRGGDKPSMRLGPLMKWARKMRKGKVNLGRVHVTCGQPLALEADTDLKELSRETMRELQNNMATTTHHLRAFLGQNPSLGLDVDWLKEAIELRGGKVLESPLGNEDQVPAEIEATMRYHWIHCFYPEAGKAFSSHPAIEHHLAENGFQLPESLAVPDSLQDRRLRRFLLSLFEPVRRDYATVAQYLSSVNDPSEAPSAKGIARELASSHLPNLQAAFSDLVDREILAKGGQNGTYVWGPKKQDLEKYLAENSTLEITASSVSGQTATGARHESKAYADHRSDWVPWSSLASKPSR